MPRTSNSTIKTVSSDAVKSKMSKPLKDMSLAQLKKECTALRKENEGYRDKLYCHLCGKFHPKNTIYFYKSTDPKSATGYSPICKECAKAIMERVDSNGDHHLPTRESLILALKYIDKPYIETVYQAAIKESEESEAHVNFTVPYMRMIASKPYAGMTFMDSDLLKTKIVYADEIPEEGTIEQISQHRQYEKDKVEVIRLIGYDPFDGEALADQPFLYSQTLGMLDSSEDANEDQLKVQSIVTIVRSFLQIKKMDDAIKNLMMDNTKTAKNAGDINKLQDSKRKAQEVITKLAAENCISMKNSKNQTKGENTWTGKIKKIKNLNLRAGEVNGFDIETCRAMRQVADLSNASLFDQLRLGEDELTDMIAEQREMLIKANRKADTYEEVFRIVLRENLDLKDLLAERNIDIKDDCVNLDQIFSKYGLNGEDVIDDG